MSFLICIPKPLILEGRGLFLEFSNTNLGQMIFHFKDIRTLDISTSNLKKYLLELKI